MDKNLKACLRAIILTLSLTLLCCRVGVAQHRAHKQAGTPATEARLAIVRTLLESKRATEALEMVSELSVANEGNFQLHYNLGVLLISESQFKPAQFELQKADSLQPGTFEVPYALGRAFLGSGNYSKAELSLDRALKLKSQSAEALYLMALVYSRESRPLDALDLLVRSNRIMPDNPDILFLMAQIIMSQKYFEDALAPLEKALKLAPQRNDIRAALGESYYKSVKVDKAIEVFKELLAIEPSARSYAYLGLSFTYLGRFDEAKQNFHNGLQLDPKNAFCLFHLGYIAKLQGDAATADSTFQKVLSANPNFPDALLELANLRIENNLFAEGAELLRKYIAVSNAPATGYYKLAMVEKKLHDTVAAQSDLATFQTLSKNASANMYPYENLFDYLDGRSKLDPAARNRQDLIELTEQLKNHPDQPGVLYPLAEAYLKAGKIDDAKDTLAQLVKQDADDYRTQANAGVLLARYHLLDDAIQHFQEALQAKPNSDEAHFDLANAYFSKGLYSKALDAALKVSAEGRQDDSYLALLGDIYAHQGDAAHAGEIFRNALTRNPESDQNYLSLALLQFRANDFVGAKQTLLKGQAHIPGSGKMIWGLGLSSAMDGNTLKAAEQFEHAVELLPEWPGSYSTLGLFYFQTGQIDRAREVLDRFKNTALTGGFDVSRIEQVLTQAPATPPTGDSPLSIANRRQLLQLALLLADKTL